MAEITGQREIYIPAGGPPQVRPPQVYEEMGEANIFAMLAAFYRELEGSTLRSLFPRDMARAAYKSGAFFVGILGGPPIYMERYGNPAMRARHMPFAIDEAGRQVWMGCFDRVLVSADVEFAFPRAAIPQFRAFLDDFSLWMVNTVSDMSDGERAVSDAAMLSTNAGIPLSASK